jgi:DNA-directed RNA polymerase subunit F
MRNDLNRSSCSAERSEERVKRLYVSLMPEQRKDLRIAFKKNGYEINAMLC